MLGRITLLITVIVTAAEASKIDLNTTEILGLTLAALKQTEILWKPPFISIKHFFKNKY